ncbi:hypothetical protein E4U41_005838 [Claviceps citrina]|nr:hypothetical protein E4U41_005838 [Claviceps citrina]
MPPGFTISQTPSHLGLDAATFARNFGTDLPPPQRASFAKKYPCGLPRGYKMVGPRDEGVPASYVEEYLPIGFYTKPPAHAPAKFSTAHGEREFRRMTHILPRRRIQLWDKDQLQARCNSTRKKYWADMKGMTRPSCWDDLWTYYDAFDLYHYGALNLWNLINQLFHENALIYDGMERECANHIGQWADEWIGVEENQRTLKAWTEEKDSSIVFILSEQDRRNMGDIPDDMIPLVASALKARRHLLLTGVDNFRKNREGASDVMEACQNRTFHNWLAGEKVFGNNALPSPPPAEDHICSPASKSAPPPCFQQDGRHYYLPEGIRPSSCRTGSHSRAVEELQKSAAAATTKRSPRDGDFRMSCVIAQGTKGQGQPSVDDEIKTPARSKEQDGPEERPKQSAGGDGHASAVGQSQQPAVRDKKEQRAPKQPEDSRTSVSKHDGSARPDSVTGSQTSPSPMPRKCRPASGRDSNENMSVTRTPPNRQVGPNHVVRHAKRASLSGQTDTGIPSHSPMPVHVRPATASGQPA